jgi:hypothetical protein
MWLQKTIIKEMNMKTWIARALTVAALMATLGPISAQDSAAKATVAEKDAFVLFDLSYGDADNIKDSTVTASGKEGKRSLTYTEHVLSCGTHMNGSLQESTKGKVLSVKGSFTIKENPYDIAKLDVDIKRPKAGGKWTGFMVVDGKRVPVELIQ